MLTSCRGLFSPAEHRDFIERLLLGALLFGVVLGQPPLAEAIERFPLDPPLLERRKPRFNPGRGPPDALLAQEQRVRQRFRVAVRLTERANVNGRSLHAGPVKLEAPQRRLGALLFRSLALQCPPSLRQFDLRLLFEPSAKPKDRVEIKSKSSHNSSVRGQG
jgi:hypothetical protein